jgi:hypothetical protein
MHIAWCVHDKLPRVLFDRISLDSHVDAVLIRMCAFGTDRRKKAKLVVECDMKRNENRARRCVERAGPRTASRLHGVATK